MMRGERRDTVATAVETRWTDYCIRSNAFRRPALSRIEVIEVRLNKLAGWHSPRVPSGGFRSAEVETVGVRAFTLDCGDRESDS
jgi:hypothetical protein